MRMETVKNANKIYFGGNNEKLFGDIDYCVMYGASGDSYFINHTNMWSGMFGDRKVPCYRISTLNQINGRIGDLIDTVFPDLDSVELYLAEN